MTDTAKERAPLLPDRLPPLSAGSPSVIPAAPSTPIAAALNIDRIEFGQTHMLQNGIRTWVQPELPVGTETLRLVEGRGARVMIELSAADAVNPRLEVWDGDKLLDSQPLLPPAQQPPTEDNGERYSPTMYTSTIGAGFMAAGRQLKVRSDNHPAGNAFTLQPLPAHALTLKVLPVYLFGATDMNSGYPVEKYGNPSAAVQKDLNVNMPFPVTTMNHPARKIVWETLSIGPIGGRPSYLARSYDKLQDGYDALDAMLGVAHSLRRANGESWAPVLYYSPVLGLNADGSVRPAGGGLALTGSGDATGNWSYSSVFIHELGHALGLNHGDAMWNQGIYPYPKGSLLGSNWGWDEAKTLFIPPYVSPSADNYASCATRGVNDAQGRCAKFDTMQGGSRGDQARGQRYGLFSDFSMARMQRTAMQYSLVNLGTDEKNDYVALNQDGQQYRYAAETRDYAYNGIYENLPRVTNVPVYTVIAAMSNAMPELNQIYAPLQYTGNLLHGIDPARPDDLAAITPGTGKYRKYCQYTGCDYTLRVTYADGSQRLQVLQFAFRATNNPTGPASSASTNPVNGASFQRWAVNVPADKPLRKIEMLYTPTAWLGVPADAAVVMSRDAP